MTRFLRTGLVLVAACAFGATAVSANVPTPEDSDVPEMMTVTPDGGIAFSVNVSGTFGPVNGAFVEVRVNAATDPLVAWCVGQVHPTITGVTNASGDVSFFVEGGGCIPSGTQVEVRADAIPLGNAGINSPDIVNAGGERPTESGVDNCDATPVTTVGLADAVEHTGNIALGLVDRCSNMTGPDYDDNVGLADAVILTGYITGGTTCTCQP